MNKNFCPPESRRSLETLEAMNFQHRLDEGDLICCFPWACREVLVSWLLVKAATTYLVRIPTAFQKTTMVPGWSINNQYKTILTILPSRKPLQNHTINHHKFTAHCQLHFAGEGRGPRLGQSHAGKAGEGERSSWQERGGLPGFAFLMFFFWPY